jgi:hypothetical protein
MVAQTMKKFNTYYLITLLLMLPVLYQCEPDHETNEVSWESKLPHFEYFGGQFISFVQGSRESFTDPGVSATVDGKELQVIKYTQPVNTNKPGVYIFQYFAKNDDNLISEGRRIIAVTHHDVSTADLSGKYLTTDSYGWGTVESRVRKLNDQGWYTCGEVMGFPGAEMEGQFVDIGNNKLFLLPGKGDFGDYGISDGNHTFTSLSWSIKLLDEPYTGIEIPVTLIKQDD